MEIYIAKNKTQMGPYDIGQVTQMLQSGILEKHDLYWHEGMLDWAPAGCLVKQVKDDNYLFSGSKSSVAESIVSYNIETPVDDITKKIIMATRVCLGLCLLGPTAMGIMGLLFSGPFALVAFILGIVILSKGKTTEGIAAIVLSLIVPIMGWGIWATSLALYANLFNK